MISIIVPTLNEEKYLPILLESIKSQTYTDYELIVADGNSKDKTREIAKRFGCKIIRESKNRKGHPGIARNLGATLAKGDYLVFFDADVTIPSNFLGALIFEIEKKRIDVGSGFSMPDTKNFIDLIMVFLMNIYFFIIQKISPHGPGYYIFSKKEIHNRINGFNEKLKLSEDHDYVKRASKAGKFSFLFQPQVTFSFRRIREEGRIKVFIKYLYAELYRFFYKDIKEEIVDYKFGQHG